jgi:hypothetical protein
LVVMAVDNKLKWNSIAVSVVCGVLLSLGVYYASSVGPSVFSVNAAMVYYLFASNAALVCVSWAVTFFSKVMLIRVYNRFGGEGQKYYYEESRESFGAPVWGQLTHSQTFATLGLVILFNGLWSVLYGLDVLLERPAGSSKGGGGWGYPVAIVSLVHVVVSSVLTLFLLACAAVSRIDHTVELNPIVQFLRCTYMSSGKRRFFCGIFPGIALLGFAGAVLYYAVRVRCGPAIEGYLLGGVALYFVWCASLASVYCSTNVRMDRLSLGVILLCDVAAIGYGVVGFAWLSAQETQEGNVDYTNCKKNAPHLLFLVVVLKTVCVLAGFGSLCCSVCCRVERYYDEYVGDHFGQKDAGTETGNDKHGHHHLRSPSLSTGGSANKPSRGGMDYVEFEDATEMS